MTFFAGTRPDSPDGIAETLERLRLTSTGTLGHLTDFGFVDGLHPLVRPSKAVGVAFTVRLPQIDGVALHYGITEIRSGEVLVIDTSGERRRALWGGVVAHAAKLAGIAGVVVDGPITDWEEVTASGVPVWCRGTTSLTGRRLGVEGAVQVPIQVGGAVVQPGDIILADSDGVFVIPPSGAADLANQMVERDKREPIIRSRLEGGERLGDITGAREAFEAGPGKT